jgi:hypothetical protein
MSSSFKTAVISAVVAAFVAAGAAVATTQAFTLGMTNRVDAASTVVNVKSNGTTNSVDAPLLTLDNRSGTPNATPLSLVASSKHPAFKVNTQTKIANLDADQLDGRDSSRYIQGTGQSGSSALTVAPQSGVRHPVLVVPGLGSFSAACLPITGTESLGSVAFENSTGGPLESTVLDTERSNTQSTILNGIVIDSGSSLDGFSEAVNINPNSANFTTWQLSTPDGSKVATAFTSIVFDSSGDCIFRATQIENG